LKAQHIIVGECMLELSARGEQLYFKSFAGDTYNTAIYLKRCNPQLDIAYWTAVGQDNISQEFASTLLCEKIDDSLVETSPDKTLGLYMINTDAKGERSFAYWRSDSAARQFLGLMTDNIKQSLEQAGSLFFSGISLAILPDNDKAAFLALLTQIKQQGCKIIFDPNYRPKLWQSVEHARTWTDRAYALADIAFPGCDDHKVLYGHNSLQEVQQHVVALGIKEIVIKNGEQGVQIFSDGQHSIVPAHQVEQVVDTTAAGDAFNGGYLAARLAGQNEQYSAHFGAKVAAFVIGHRGAIVDKKLMDDFIEVNQAC
jgi:2-dehydro-3-deoxygluconokinase